MGPVGERGLFPTGTPEPYPCLTDSTPVPGSSSATQAQIAQTVGNSEYPPQEVPQKSTEPGSFSSDFIEKQQHWGPCRQGHTPTWAPSLSSWELGSSPGPRGYFGTSWGLRTPPPPLWAHSTNSGTNHNSEIYHCVTPSHTDQTQSVLSKGLPASLPYLSHRSQGQRRLSWPGGVVLHSHGAGQGRGGSGHSERQPQDPASYHKESAPRSETVPTCSLPLLHMCTYKHTHAHIHTHMKLPTHTHMHTHATHECDFLGTYSHMTAHDYKWHVLVHTHTYSYRCSYMHTHTPRCTCSHVCTDAQHRWVCTFMQVHPFFKMANYCYFFKKKKIHPTVVKSRLIF